MVLLFLVLLKILNNKAAAGRNLVCSVAVAGYNDCVLDDLLKLGNAGIQLALLVLGFIILGVLGQVAEGACFLQLLCNLIRTGSFQIFQFVLICVQTFLCQFNFFCHVCKPFLLSVIGFRAVQYTIL